MTRSPNCSYLVCRERGVHHISRCNIVIQYQDMWLWDRSILRAGGLAAWIMDRIQTCPSRIFRASFR